MYLCLMYVCPDVSNSGGGDVPTSDVSKSAPSSGHRVQMGDLRKNKDGIHR